MVATLTESAGVGVRDDMPAGTMNRLVNDFVHFFKLLADDTRMRIVLYLARNREMHVRALCKHLRQSQPAVSHHLALMLEDGLIDRRRQGKHNYYKLQSERLQEILELFSSFLPPDEDVLIQFDSDMLDYLAPEAATT
jgi:ArsR family transcriptional regulator